MEVNNYTLHIRRLEIAEQPEFYMAQVGNADTVGFIARSLIGHEAQEVFIAICLDIKNRVLGYTEVGRGGIDNCAVDIRQVFRTAIALGASNLVISHGHPSGDTTPSREDDLMTDRVVQAGKLLGIPVLDHVIVACGNSPSYSYAAHGRMRKE